MPISNEEWDAGRTSETLEGQILNFLNKNSEKAFNLIEIILGLGYGTNIKDIWSFLGGMAQYWVFQNAIEQLVKEGKVTAKIIEEANKKDTYYKAVIQHKPKIGHA